MPKTMTPNMELTDLLLREKTGKSLAQTIRHARRVNAATGKPTETWDDIAFEIRTVTGRSAVRESVINWATRLGVVDERQGTVADAEVSAA